MYYDSKTQEYQPTPRCKLCNVLHNDVSNYYLIGKEYYPICKSCLKFYSENARVKNIMKMYAK